MLKRDFRWMPAARITTGILLLGAILVVGAVPVVTLTADEDTAVARAAAVFFRHVASKGYDTLRSEDSDVLSPGQTMTYTVTLYRGVDYILFAAGDNNIEDLDIYLYDEEGNRVARDTLTDNYPVVSVTPRWTGEFKLQIRNYEGRRGWYHMAIAY